MNETPEHATTTPPDLAALAQQLEQARARQEAGGNFNYSGEHCSRCGAYVGVDRWDEYPEYGSHGCLWGDARVIVVPRDVDSDRELSVLLGRLEER